MLSAWVPHKRPNGAPSMTYGRTLHKALDKFHIDRELWPQLAANRPAWRETLRLGHPAIRQSKQIAQRPRAQLPAVLIPRARRPLQANTDDACA